MQCPFEVRLGAEVISEHVVRRAQHGICDSRVFRVSGLLLDDVGAQRELKTIASVGCAM